MKSWFWAAILAALPALSANGALVDRYTFDDPVPGDATREQDLGADNTPVSLFNGAPRVADGAIPGSTYSLRTGPVAGGTNDDWKGGVFFPTGSAGSTMTSTAGVTGITIMGWFKPLTAPSGTTSLMGLLVGDDSIAPNAHNGRALFEIENNHLVALGRRRDWESTRPVITSVATLDQILPTNQWTFLAATFDYDHGSIVLYRNGAVLATTGPSSYSAWGLTAGVDTTSSTSSAGLKIGGQVDDDTTPFNGLVDELRIYNETLPASGANSIAAIYAAQIAPVPVPESHTGLILLVAVASLLLPARRRQPESARGAAE